MRGGGRVLIVEDNATNRDLLVRMLARQGLATTVAEDGAWALFESSTGSWATASWRPSRGATRPISE